MEKNIVNHHYHLDVTDRRKANGHSSFLLFFTGLSGSGKSTIANALEQKLFEIGVRTYVLDGDNVRSGINCDLTFSPEDRSENIRRIGEISHLMVDAGLVVLAAFVAPYEKDREFIKNAVGAENHVQIFVDTSLELCEQRDAKGLYKKAREGKIKNMTGISAPYEIPENPDVHLPENYTVEESVAKILDTIKNRLS